MKATWRRAAGAFRDAPESRDGTANGLAVFWNYDLLSWTFGVRLEIDESWYDLHFDAGPVEISFCYFRTSVFVLHDTTGPTTTGS